MLAQNIHISAAIKRQRLILRIPQFDSMWIFICQQSVLQQCNKLTMHLTASVSRVLRGNNV